MTERLTGRRSFLKATVLGSATALLAGMFPFVFKAGAAEARELNNLQAAKLSTFSKLVGEVFQIRIGPLNGVTVWLDEVTKHDQRSFSLVFRGGADAPIEQDTYTFRHESLGEFPLFVVPIGPGSDGLYYEAVFNRENK
jgi:hypothetical protein